MQFTKPPKSFDEQIDLLIKRGMVIDDRHRAKRYLSHLNYYRLAAYWLPYEDNHPTHLFKTGTNFDLIIEHYVFDRGLRLLVMDAIERIEVSIRTQWAYHLSHSYGPHAHLQRELFKSKWSYPDNMARLKKSADRSSEIFIRHFKKYDEEQGQNPNDLALYGQDSNGTVWSICNMNMILHNVTRFTIENGDTLETPQIIKDGKIKKFDRVLANQLALNQSPDACY